MGPHAMTAELKDLERELLDFERQRWRYLGAKETAVRERFGLSLTRHSQMVNELIDRPEALEYDAQLVNRLRRLRDARRGQRSARRLAG